MPNTRFTPCWRLSCSCVYHHSQICASPTIHMLSSDACNYIGCPWAGLSSIAETVKQNDFTALNDLTLDNGIIRRNYNMLIRGVSPETRVTVSHMAVGIFAKNVGEVWFQALLKTPSSSGYHRLRSRSQGGPKGSVKSWAPLVRVTCDVFDAAFYIRTGLQRVSSVFSYQ